jgi:predicted ribosome quality control (RQC) complex YloA/Tae2 family protein
LARIAGINIPTGKRAVIALTYIHGIGRTSAKKICETCGISEDRRVSDLSDDEIARVRDLIDQDHTVEGRASPRSRHEHQAIDGFGVLSWASSPSSIAGSWSKNAHQRADPQRSCEGDCR